MSMERRLENLERLEGLGCGRQRPAPSQTEQEAHALDAEIREIEEHLQDLDVDPNEWRHTANDRAHMTLDEHIAALEKEIHDDDHH